MNPEHSLPEDDLLALLMADEAGAPDAIAASTDHQPQPLSFAQQRLWFVQQFAPLSSAYNLPRALVLEGDLAADALDAALQQVIQRHDILRTRFEEIDGQPLQVLAPHARLALQHQDLSALNATERDAQL